MEKFISSYEAACAKLGKSTQLPDLSSWEPDMHKHLTGVHKLSMIVKANNPPGWVANVADTRQKKWYAVHEVIPDQEAPGGFRLSFVASGCDLDYAVLGVRLAYFSSELSDFIGTECIDIYADLNG